MALCAKVTETVSGERNFGATLYACTSDKAGSFDLKLVRSDNDACFDNQKAAFTPFENTPSPDYNQALAQGLQQIINGNAQPAAATYTYKGREGNIVLTLSSGTTVEDVTDPKSFLNCDPKPSVAVAKIPADYHSPTLWERTKNYIPFLR